MTSASLGTPAVAEHEIDAGASRPANQPKCSGTSAPLLGDDGQIEPAADHARDLAQREAFLGDREIDRVRRVGFDREPVQARCVARVDAPPAMCSVSDVRC